MSTRKIVDLDQFAKELGNFSKLSLAKKRKAVISGVARSIPDLVASSPVDTGLYAASWQFTPTEKGAVIGNTAPYAGIIEYGTRPFTPPIGPLLAWAHRVLNNSGAARGQPLTKEQQAATGNSALSGYSDAEWALAVHTQKKIAEFGMQPRHIMENAIPQIIDNIRQELKRVR